jgi:hypothetical protein
MPRIFWFVFGLAASPALADAPQAQPAPSEQSAVQNFGAAHPDCLGWTDGCVICTRKACSTPGIACTPHEPVCAAQAAPAVAPPPQKP